jgi:hypothetical protein
MTAPHLASSLTLALALGLALPTAADAQFQFGFAGGPSFPMGDLADQADTGVHMRGGLDLQIPFIPVGARLDVLWQNLPSQQTGSYTQLGALLNGTFRLPMPILRPYLVAGVGQMRHDEPGDVPTVTDFAWAAGAGVDLRLLIFGAFVEARYLDWGNGNRSVPLTVGVTF